VIFKSMKAHQLKSAALPNVKGAAKAHAQKKIRRSEVDNFRKALREARPERGLLTLISRNWSNEAFREAIEGMAPMKRIPDEIRKFLEARVTNDDQRIAFLRVIFAQANNQFDPVYQIPNWPFNDLATLQKFVKDMKEATRRSMPKGWRLSRVSNRGITDPRYNWHQNSPHKLPDLAEGLGMTPAGLRKRCRNRKIPIIVSKIPRRAGTIAAKHARILLKEQLEKPANRLRDMKRKCREPFQVKHLQAANQPSGATLWANPFELSAFNVRSPK